MSTRNLHSPLVPFAAPPTGEDPALAFQPAEGTGHGPNPGLDYYGACRPAGGVSGDFFDFIPLDDRWLLASVGEAPGRGMASSALMAAVEAHFRGVAIGSPGALAAAASQLNRALCEIESPGTIATLFCACIDAWRRTLRYLSAGHEPALLFRAGRPHIHRLEPTGTVLGLTARTVFRQRTVTLDPGDVLIAYTAGVTDGQPGCALGEAGLIEAVEDHRNDPPRILVERVLQTAARCGNGASRPADQTVLAIRVAGSAGSLNQGRAEALAFAAA